MSSVIVAGDVSGSVSLTAPSAAGSTVITLPSTSGTMLTTASSGQSIPKAALPTGSVLQVVNNLVEGKFSTSSGSPTKLATSSSITPTSATSKIIVLMSTSFGNDGGGGNCMFSLVRTISGADTTVANYIANANYASTAYVADPLTWQTLDAPSTTSAITYSIVSYRVDGTSTPFCGGRATDNFYKPGVTFTLMEIAA